MDEHGRSQKTKQKLTKSEQGAGAIATLRAEKKKRRQLKETMHSSQELHESLMLDSGKKGKKKMLKKANNDVVWQERVSSNGGKNSVHLSDDDDMLLNFNMHSGASTMDQSKAAGNDHRKDKKTEMVLVKDERSALMRRVEGKNKMVGTDDNSSKTEMKKKKRKKDEEGQDLQYIDNGDVNGSTQQNKLQYDTSTDKQKLKNKNKMAKPEVMDAPQNMNSPVVLSSRPTFSMAVAGSIVDNAQSLELATMLSGQIARAAAIFRVDEIVVFDDYDGEKADKLEEVGGLFMVRILKYLEVPQYLRRALIPMDRSLSSVGKLPPLDAPHHLRKHEWRPFREGMVLDRRPSSGSGSCVDVGLDKEVLIGQSLKPGTRVTVAMGQSKADGDVLQVVDREAARKAGFYWGYTIRYANCLSAVFDECPYEGKYDFCIGTSEHGEKIRSTDLVIPKCKHLLVVFGGLSGLEESFELDRKLKKRSLTSVFHRYLNTCPDQGSRTIRTEEAILISLQFLQPAIQEVLYTP
ncbi:hypothetical protein L7F22_034825 [Adiantum nelumboides]|nr:hypothetical protein [Adiantum nelumboides]